jgi:hypothetical protein
MHHFPMQVQNFFAFYCPAYYRAKQVFVAFSIPPQGPLFLALGAQGRGGNPYVVRGGVRTQ